MTLTSDLKDRLPLDKHTLQWWNEKLEDLTKGYRGACHGTNLAIAQCEECSTKCDALRADIEALRKELAAVSEKLDKVATYVKANVKKNGGKE
jgi:hypothetical protein